MVNMSAAILANTVSAYSIIFAGLFALALSLTMRPQPFRWSVVYLAISLSGIASVWHESTGGIFPARIADICGILFLLWVAQIAVLFDFYSPLFRRMTIAFAGIINLFSIWLIYSGGAKQITELIINIPFGKEWGYSLSETIMLVNGALLVILIFSRFGAIAVNARPLLYLTSGIFFLGVLLSIPATEDVDFQFLAYHSIWHIAASYAFISFWAFNHVRFEKNK